MWVHHYEPESKRQYGLESSCIVSEEEIQNSLFDGKTYANHFWDSKSLYWKTKLKRIYSARYTVLLTKNLKQVICTKRRSLLSKRFCCCMTIVVVFSICLYCIITSCHIYKRIRIHIKFQWWNRRKVLVLSFVHSSFFFYFSWFSSFSFFIMISFSRNSAILFTFVLFYFLIDSTMNKEFY